MQASAASNQSSIQQKGPASPLHIPSSEHDDRPLISDLLKEYGPAIEAVRENLKSNQNFQLNNGTSGCSASASASASSSTSTSSPSSPRYDDIWILRYLLSHQKNVQNASKAALATMRFREEHKLNDQCLDVSSMIPNFNQSREHIHSSFYGIRDNMKSRDAIYTSQPDLNRGVLTIFTLKNLDLKKMDEDMSDDDMRYMSLMNKEAVYRILDAVTRKTGRLTRQMKILDLDGFTLKMVSMSYLKRDGRASKSVEDYYPQLLGTTYVVNAPSWIGQVWNTIRPLFPKRFVDKVHIFGKKEKKANILKKLLRYISEEDLPDRYGGKNESWPLPHISDAYGRRSASPRTE